jgi:hypothetical protein
LLTVLYTAVLFASSVFHNRRIHEQPLFWLAISNILYFSCIVPYMSMYRYFLHLPRSVGIALASIVFILNFIRYPLVGISFILLGQEQRARTAITS